MIAVVKTLLVSEVATKTWTSSHSLDCRQTLALKVARLRSAGCDIRGGVNEFLQRDVSVAALTVKVAVLVGRVFDVEGVVLGSDTPPSF